MIALEESHRSKMPVVAASLAPDASWAVTVTPGWVHIWANGEIVWGFGSTRIHIRADTPVAAALYYQVLRVIWIADGLLRQLERPPDTLPWPRHPPHPVPAPVRALGLSPSGSLAVLACDDGTLRSFDAGTEEFGWTLPTGDLSARAVAVASDRGPIVAAFADGSIRRYNFEARTSDLVGVGPPAQAVAVTPDGQVVVTAGADGLLQRWGRRTGALPESRMLEMVITAVAVDETGDRVLVGADNGKLWLHDLTSDPRVEYVIPPPPDHVAAPKGPSSPPPPVALPPPMVDDDVRFTVYRPQVLPPGRWASLLVFAHKTDPVVEPGKTPIDPTKQVEARARAYFGGGIGRPIGVDARQGLRRGAQLRVVPELPGILCNPEYDELEWWEPVHEVRFRLLAGPDLAGTVVRGMVRVWCGPLILGEVSITLPVAASDPGADSPPTAESVVRYRKIFPSYSYQDRAIVQDFAEAARALGDQYLQDVLTLRAGERWDSRLLQLIEDADVFQLFWSYNSMRSPHCRDEWEHALTLQRPLFIRPLYWEEPRPEDPGQQLPPPALQALHFVKVLPASQSPAPLAPQSPAPPAALPEAGSLRKRRTSLMLALLIGLLIAAAGVVAFQILGR